MAQWKHESLLLFFLMLDKGNLLSIWSYKGPDLFLSVLQAFSENEKKVIELHATILLLETNKQTAMTYLLLPTIQT